MTPSSMVLTHIYDIYVYFIVCETTCSHTSVTWLLFYVCDMTPFHMCDVTPFYMCDVTPFHVCDVIHLWRDFSSMCVTWLPRVWDSFICVICMCDMNHIWHVCVTWIIHMCVTWFIHVYGTTYACVGHDSFMCMTWPTDTRDMTHSCVWHDSFICVAWHIRMGGMTHSYVWHDSFICVTWLIHMCGMTHCREMIAGKGRLSQIFALSYVCMCDMTSLHTCVTRFLFICVW